MPDSPIEAPKLPSADLIQFRFDRIDEAVNKLDKKVDYFTQTFLSKDESALLISERNEKIANAQKELTTLIEDVRKEAKSTSEAVRKEAKTNHDTLKKQLDEEKENRVWRNRAIFVAVISALFVSIGTLVVTLMTTHK